MKPSKRSDTTDLRRSSSSTVYEGEQDDDSSVKPSAGKLQKAGVQTEVAERRTLNTMVRAPASESGHLY